MSVVVLRCPNCGTTKASLGECEACHEAQVRYFCTNHTPGRWLEAPECKDCGARFGQPAHPRAVPLPPVTSPSSAAPASASTPPRTGSAPRLDKARGPWGRRERPSPEEARLGARDGSVPVHDGTKARLPELISRTTAGIGRKSGRIMPTSEAPAARLALAGCMIRALFLAVFLLMVFFALSTLIGGSLFQLFWVYY